MALFKEQRDNTNNDLIGYIRTDGTCYPVGHATIVKWIADGGVPDADDTALLGIKVYKINEYITESNARVSAQVPEWTGDFIEQVASIWNMLKVPNAAQAKAKDIYVYVKDTAIPAVNAMSTVSEVLAVDVANDPNWPV
jgi:hypothetical protein